MHLTLYVTGLSSFIILCLGILAVFRNRNLNISLPFLFLSATISGWLACGFVMEHQLLHDINPLHTSRISMSFASFIGAAFVGFAVNFSMRKTAYYALVVRLAYVLALVSAIVSLNGLFMKDIKVVNHVAIREFGALSIFFTVHLIGCVLFGTYLLVRMYVDHPSPMQKLRAKYILLGLSSCLFVSIFFSLILPLLGYNDLFFLGHVGAIIIIYCTYAMIKQRIMNFSVMLTRSGILILIYAIVLGVPFWVAYNTDSLVLSLSLMGILATTGPVVYPVIQRRADNVLLAKQRRYHILLADTIRRTIEEYNLDTLLKSVVQGIKDTVGINFVTVYLHDKHDDRYRLRGGDGLPNVPLDHEIKSGNPIIRQMTGSKEPFFIEELHAEAQVSLAFPLKSSLIVPLFDSGEAIGFFLLGDKSDGSIYIEEDIAVFQKVSRHVTLAIKNSILIEDLKNAQEKVFNAEKIALIYGMAEGAAHRIGHRLNDFAVAGHQIGVIANEIRTALTGAPGSGANFEEKLNLLLKHSQTIKETVKKTDMITDEIVNYAQAKEETDFRELSFRVVVEDAANIAAMKLGEKTLPLTTDIEANDEIFGIKGQIVDCIISCMCNSYEAIRIKTDYWLTSGDKNSFRPEIRIALKQSEGSSRIMISDNGLGVKEENKTKIFSAFFTTKPSSKGIKGISLYVAKRIIEENHGGRIWFDSEYLKGTTFYIDLNKRPRIR